MNMDIKFAFFEKLEKCGVFSLIDSFFVSGDFAALAGEAQPFRMNIGPKGLTIISPDGSREYARQRFEDSRVPDMPANLLRDFMGIVIEYCQEHHGEYEYRFAPRELAEDEINPAEARLVEFTRDIPSPDTPVPGTGFGFHNRPGGDFGGSRPGSGSGNYRIYNRPGGDYSGPRAGGMPVSSYGAVRRQSSISPVPDARPSGYVIGVMKK